MLPVIYMDRSNIDKIARTSEDRLLLAKLWDKLQPGFQREIPASTCFLSQREQEMAKYLFGDAPELIAFGGYENAERKMLIYVPEYMGEDSVWETGSPVVCLRASFYHTESPSHRDFLGALIGCGIGREMIGDICVGTQSCDFFVADEVAPFLLQSFDSAGRVKLKLTEIPLSDANIPEPAVSEIKDTLASVRLDSVISSGFRIGRNAAAQYICAGKATIDGLSCEKPDKAVAEGMKITVRGLGKMKLVSIGGLTKKGRISVVIHRYI